MPVGETTRRIVRRDLSFRENALDARTQVRGEPARAKQDLVHQEIGSKSKMKSSHDEISV